MRDRPRESGGKVELPIDVAELKKRIALVRKGSVEPVRPRSAQRAAPVQSGQANATSPLQRAYKIPVAGYLLRICTAIVNLPHILKNIRALDEAHAAEAARTQFALDELRFQLAQAERAAAVASQQVEKLRGELEALKHGQAVRTEAEAKTRSPGNDR